MSVVLKELAKRKRSFYFNQDYISDYDELGITILTKISLSKPNHMGKR